MLLRTQMNIDVESNQTNPLCCREHGTIRIEQCRWPKSCVLCSVRNLNTYPKSRRYMNSKQVTPVSSHGVKGPYNVEHNTVKHHSRNWIFNRWTSWSFQWSTNPQVDQTRDIWTNALIYIPRTQLPENLGLVDGDSPSSKAWQGIQGCTKHREMRWAAKATARMRVIATG
jgi:hypothetical protein